jgi:hypothetical protein
MEKANKLGMNSQLASKELTDYTFEGTSRESSMEIRCVKSKAYKDWSSDS